MDNRVIELIHDDLAATNARLEKLTSMVQSNAIVLHSLDNQALTDDSRELDFRIEETERNQAAIRELIAIESAHVKSLSERLDKYMSETTEYLNNK